MNIKNDNEKVAEGLMLVIGIVVGMIVIMSVIAVVVYLQDMKEENIVEALAWVVIAFGVICAILLVMQ